MCTYGIGLPFDHPIWQSLPPCNCGTTALPMKPAIRLQDFGVRIQPEPDIYATPLPPARGKRAKRKRYEAPTR